MKTLVICLALIAGLLAMPHRAAAQVVVLHPGYPMVAPAPFVPYGFYGAPPYYPGFYPGLLGGVRAYGIGQYPPGYWGTDAVWRATEPHVHGYRWE